ncbi:MAG: dephospho-CoA kinase [Chloroflexota bacterium]
MSSWAGKYVIGLTGNIAAGKSVVRKMLEHLGAYGIDADALSHRAIAKGAPGYQQVVENFGKWVLMESGEIDRPKLGELVFTDEEALAKLEGIVHPLVRQAIDHLVSKSNQKVIVIEAIKLLESPLREAVDTIWVTTTDDDTQLKRLREDRGMSPKNAKARIAAQSSQGKKVLAADTLIENSGSYESTWKQVQSAWVTQFPKEAEEASAPVEVAKVKTGSLQNLSVLRARPKQSEQIASLINRISGGGRSVTSFDIMAAFGEKAFMLLMLEDNLVGVLGWKVENLVARTDEVYLDDTVRMQDAIPFLMGAVDNSSVELQCEASLIFVSPAMAKEKETWKTMGYENRKVESLSVNAWQAAAKESQADGTVMLFKQLRVDRVLKPI